MDFFLLPVSFVLVLFFGPFILFRCWWRTSLCLRCVCVCSAQPSTAGTHRGTSGMTLWRLRRRPERDTSVSVLWTNSHPSSLSLNVAAIFPRVSRVYRVCVACFIYETDDSCLYSLIPLQVAMRRCRCLSLSRRTSSMRCSSSSHTTPPSPP